MKEEIKLLKNAYETYNLDNREEVANKVLAYIKIRLNENKNFIEQLLEATKECEKVSFDDIISAFDRACNRKEIYKQEKNLKMNEQGFVSNIYTTSVGLIAVETYNPIYIIEYFVLAIQSRNVIAISDIEYEEESIKSAILIIFTEALKKFNIDHNIINIIPFEECDYNLFDKLIVIDDKTTTNFKKSSNEIFLYVEDDFFASEAENEKNKLIQSGKNVRIIKNNFYDSIEKINANNAFGACIYTKNPKLGYKFINLAKADNVFVNSSMYYSEEIEKSKNPLYKNKKIMYELGSIKEKQKDSNFENKENSIQNNIPNSSVNKFEQTIENEKIYKEIENITQEIIKNKIAKNNENKISENINTEKQSTKVKNTEINHEFRLVVYENSTPWYKRIFKKLIELKRKLMGETFWE